MPDHVPADLVARRLATAAIRDYLAECLRRQISFERALYVLIDRSIEVRAVVQASEEVDDQVIDALRDVL